MNIGIGDVASGDTGIVDQSGKTAGVPASSTTVPTFMQGLQLWGTPSAALTTLTTMAHSPSVAFGAALLPFTLGVLAVPLGIIAVVMSMNEGGKR